jgi:hypothetical protein
MDSTIAAIRPWSKRALRPSKLQQSGHTTQSCHSRCIHSASTTSRCAPTPPTPSAGDCEACGAPQLRHARPALPWGQGPADGLLLRPWGVRALALVRCRSLRRLLRQVKTQSLRTRAAVSTRNQLLTRNPSHSFACRLPALTANILTSFDRGLVFDSCSHPQ